MLQVEIIDKEEAKKQELQIKKIQGTFFHGRHHGSAPTN